MKNKKYSIEEIDYIFDSSSMILSEDFKKYVLRVLSFLDKEIVDKISEGVLFYNQNDIYGHCIFLNSNFLKNKKAIIFLSENLLKKNKKEIIKWILHEIAHFYLNHKSDFLFSEKLHKKQEQEAETLALEWLKNA